ncbi:alpha-L-arabinofuranosidase C-terminal domain-containing protein [uncultured Parabacteroides sp.]|uniref:alpha-L-arabinofuranosidase C-terminal domain-containing protein n=1 Tax=uncultured Parabacteroides sp. TaxID=512312 RepID=UPI0026DBA16D|nr:alpha-L-arabinofuranosidase C-terminal domain-containing protein [uncultured Parabacteroides sp.]
MRKHLSFFILILFLLPGVFSQAKTSSSSDIRYLFAYFTDKNENRNGMHLAWSADGYTWTPIGPEHSFLKCDYGTWYADKRMRDPFVMKGPDGLWHCIWTLNWDGNAIGYAHSEDLVHWSRQSYPKVMEGYEVRNCWAPEMIYDDENRQYVIFWASTIKENGVWKTEPGEKYDHRMYYTTTKDFKTFSPAKIFFDPGHNVIDVTIQKKDGKYYMLYKDERIWPKAKKELSVAVSDHATGPYLPTGDKPFATDWVEGPAVCPLSDGSYVVYMDAYTRHRYEAKRTRDFRTWEDVTDRISIPKDAKHGSIITVTKEFVDNILSEVAAWQYRENLRNERLALPDSLKNAVPVEADITVHAGQAKKISDELFGVFFEDLNYAADGGLYAELVQNRDFEYSSEDGSREGWDSGYAWHAKDGNATLTIAVTDPVHENNPHYAVLDVQEPGAALCNDGFDGISLKRGEKYDFSLFARIPEGSKGGKVDVRLLNQEGEVVAKTSVTATSKEWQKQKAVLTATADVRSAVLALVPQKAGKYEFDLVSLFPQKTFKGRPNGLRADLAQAIADLHPRFMRFPGGCLAHGDGVHNIYNWKETVGPLESRKPQRNLWGYHQTKGLGYYEFFQFSEDIGAEPVPVIAAGVCCQNSRGGGQQGVPMCEMDAFIQDIVDLVEYANGDASTKWGSVRAEAGHPEPFHLKYIGIGNEDQITDAFEERFTMIYRVLKEKHPEITVIGTAGPFNEGTDYEEGWDIVDKLGVPMVDEHYYQTPGWFLNNQHFYDSYNRKGAKVYLGEYAAHLPGRPNNLEVSLAEAAYMTSLERNGDIVSMASYAPLLAKEGHTQWNPDLIYFDNLTVKPTVNYYVQQMYGLNAGDEYLPVTVRLSDPSGDIAKRLPVSVVKDSKTGDLIVKLVNILSAATRTNIRLDGVAVVDTHAVKTVLSGALEDTDLKPQTSDCTVGCDFTCELPAYSLSVIRIKKVSLRK